MENQDIFILNNKAYSNNNALLLEVINKLENIVNDLNSNKQIDLIINQVKNIITAMHNVINENRKNNIEIKEDIKHLHKDMLDKFEKLDKNNISDNYINKTKIYNYGKQEKE